MLLRNITLHNYTPVCLPVVDGRLSRFQFQATMSKAALNVHVQVFVWIHVYVLISLGELFSNGTTGSHLKGTFSFIRNSQTVFQSGCAVLLPLVCVSVPAASHPSEHPVWSVFF